MALCSGPWPGPGPFRGFVNIFSLCESRPTVIVGISRHTHRRKARLHITYCTAPCFTITCLRPRTVLLGKSKHSHTVTCVITATCLKNASLVEGSCMVRTAFHSRSPLFPSNLTDAILHCRSKFRMAFSNQSLNSIATTKMLQGHKSDRRIGQAIRTNSSINHPRSKRV